MMPFFLPSPFRTLFELLPHILLDTEQTAAALVLGHAFGV